MGNWYDRTVAELTHAHGTDWRGEGSAEWGWMQASLLHGSSQGTADWAGRRSPAFVGPRRWPSMTAGASGNGGGDVTSTIARSMQADPLCSIHGRESRSTGASSHARHMRGGIVSGSEPTGTRRRHALATVK